MRISNFIKLSLSLLLLTVLFATNDLALAEMNSTRSIDNPRAIFKYLFSELKLPHPADSQIEAELQQHIRDQEPEDAKVLAKQLVVNNVKLSTRQPLLVGKLLTNLAILEINTGEPKVALDSLKVALKLIQQSTGPFSQAALNVNMAMGFAKEKLGLYSEAITSFRHAQNITHRNDGVYSFNQLEMVNHITKLNIRQGDVISADSEQMFNLRINEIAYGKNNEILLETLQELGGYFAVRGRREPLNLTLDARYYRESLFRKSISFYNRAINIIEDKYGVESLRLLEPLHGLARARLYQITNRSLAEEALKRALHIVQAQPDSKASDQIRAMVSLADMYTINNNRKARDLYLEAWNLLQSTSSADQLSAEIFGSPTRLYPEVESNLALPNRPRMAKEDETEFFVTFSYTVGKNGHVARVRVLDKNIPSVAIRVVRTSLSDTRFRPRMLDGDFVATENLVFHQSFEVQESATDLDKQTTEQEYDEASLLVPTNELYQLVR